MNNETIYSTMVRSGRTTYFIDVREAKNGNKYISLSETKSTPTTNASDRRSRFSVRQSSSFCKP